MLKPKLDPITRPPSLRMLTVLLAMVGVSLRKKFAPSTAEPLINNPSAELAVPQNPVYLLPVSTVDFELATLTPVLIVGNPSIADLGVNESWLIIATR